MTSPPILSVQSGPLAGQRYEIDARGLRIGRDPGNELCIPSPSVSRHHARVLLHNGAIWVQDAGSRNGVFVNGQRVAGHRQVGPGDRITVGESEFVIELPGAEEGDSPVAMDMAAEVARKGRSRRPPLWLVGVVTAVVVLVVMVLIALRGGGGEPAEPVPDPGTVGQQVPADGAAYTLSGALSGQPPPAEPAEEEPAAEGGDPLTAQLANLVGEELDEMAGWPDPPEGATLGELLDRADAHLRAGRLHDALETYQMAYKLDRSCEVCKVRIERLRKEIDEKIEKYFQAGLRYYDSLQYREAIQAWRTVLLLDPDPESPQHIKASEYIKEAEARIRKPF